MITTAKPAATRNENPILTSERAVSAARAPATRRTVFRIGPNTPGLELRVSGQAKSWSIRYRVKGGEQNRVTCGNYPAVSLAAARIRAEDIAAAAARGIDLPAEVRRECEEQRKAAARPQTVGDLLDEYLVGYCRTNQRRWQLVERMFDTQVKPAIGNIWLTKLRRADIVELLDGLQIKKGLRAQVNRVRSQVIAAMNWAVEREYIAVEREYIDRALPA